MKHPQDPQGVPALSLWPRDPRRVERDVHLGKQRTGRARRQGGLGTTRRGTCHPIQRGYTLRPPASSAGPQYRVLRFRAENIPRTPHGAPRRTGRRAELQGP